MSQVSLQIQDQSKIDEVAEEIKATITEGEFTARWTLLETYHRVGTIIINNFPNPTKATATLAAKINRSERTLWYAVAFAKKFPDLQLLPEGKNISWHKVINKYLTDGGEGKETHLIECPKCGFTFEPGDAKEKVVELVKPKVIVQKYSSINDITEADIAEIADKYKVNPGFVKLQYEKLQNYCKSKGKVYKDYKAALRNFVLGDMQRVIERKGVDNAKRGVDARNI